jgi:hypothetical protein
MAKTTTEQPAETPAAAPDPVIGLTDYCRQLSSTLRKPELISAFYHHAGAAGQVKATTAQFDAAFEAFKAMPL